MTRSRTRHIATYAGMLHEGGCELAGRVLGRPDAKELGTEGWWQSIRSSWRRFDTATVAGAKVELSFRGANARAVTNEQGYYAVTLPVGAARAPELWEIAEARLEESGEMFAQPVLCIPTGARFGVISDIDDIILKSSVTRWQTAARLLFMRTARTRKPLEGVAGLYRALQSGTDGRAANPIFYLSAAPWSLYDLLDDFLQLNAIPLGPLQLRDVELDAMSWRDASQAQNKVEAMEILIARYPQLKWLLIGDSAQVEAGHYADLALRYPGRIHAIYLREADPHTESHRAARSTALQFERLEGSGVPMLRVRDSDEIAAHARSLGLIAAEQLPEISEEVRRDQARPQQQVNGIPPLTGQAESVA